MGKRNKYTIEMWTYHEPTVAFYIRFLYMRQGLYRYGGAKKFSVAVTDYGKNDKVKLVIRHVITAPDGGASFYSVSVYIIYVPDFHVYSFFVNSPFFCCIFGKQVYFFSQIYWYFQF